MDKSTRLRFHGFCNTHSISTNKTVFQEFEQIRLKVDSTIKDSAVKFINQRLGKLVEEFVFYELKQADDVHWIKENIQIQNGKQTIGELDALFYLNEKPIHLEIIYKFYLYDNISSYEDPLAYWIGPNRKDTLLYKLNKLKTKQFPLLHNSVTQPYLEEQNLKKESIKQQICFKAQLFLPYNSNPINIEPLNEVCVSGFYIAFKNTIIFKHIQFYIPKKLDWLIIPYAQVEWLNYEVAVLEIEDFINNKRSPLIWLKFSNTDIKKCFVTWW